MMRLRDPRAPVDKDGRPDGLVEVAGDLVPVESDGTFSHPGIDRVWAEAYAERNGATYEEVVVDGDTTSGEYPTNEDGDPLCVGKSDGQCSRVVDSPGGVCWQHDD